MDASRDCESPFAMRLYQCVPQVGTKGSNSRSNPVQKLQPQAFVSTLVERISTCLFLLETAGATRCHAQVTDGAAIPHETLSRSIEAPRPETRTPIAQQRPNCMAQRPCRVRPAFRLDRNEKLLNKRERTLSGRFDVGHSGSVWTTGSSVNSSNCLVAQAVSS